MSSWSEISPAISPAILAVLKEHQFHTPTPVQSSVIPHFLSNKDVAVQAVTGSGKTLAFVIPIIEKLRQRKGIWKRSETGVIVILPTRELAVQVAEVVKLFLPLFRLSLQLLIGGNQEVAKDVESINRDGGNVIVATPGRLADLLERKDCQLATSVKSLEVLVLDEADRLMDLGFEATLNTVLSYLPKQRRTGLFSATLKHEVEMLVRGGLRNPVYISMSSSSDAEQTTPETLTNYFIETSAEVKLTHLMTFLTKHRNDKLIVFFATCAGVNYYSELTKRLLPEVTVLALHGKMRAKRQSLFDRFLTLDNGALMSTDVMARGIDIPDVDWVVQFDPPSAAESFIHRCGRTARMGRIGRSLIYLLPPSESAYVQYMEISQRLILQPLPEEEVGELLEPRTFISNVRSKLATERELYDLSVRAFVSFVRFYRKHECHLIFNVKALDLVSLAYGTYALLHLPKMPELKGQDTSGFDPDPVAVDDIPYKDKNRKKQALALKRKKEAAWAAKMDARKMHLKKKSAQERRVNRKNRRRKNHTFSTAELDELAEEARLLKHYKRGKISKEELERQLDAFNE